MNLESLVTKDYLAARFAEQNARIDTRFAEQQATMDNPSVPFIPQHAVDSIQRHSNKQDYWQRQ